MGYTHYWTQTKTLNKAQWADVASDVRQIIYAAAVRPTDPVLIERGGDIGGYDLAPGTVDLNGLGSEGCETFRITKARALRSAEDKRHGAKDGWNFCKTERRPYDVIVTAILCYLESVPGAWSVDSDGDAADWQAGLALARYALPRYDNQLHIPAAVQRAEIECGPWLEPTPGFNAFFAIDGAAYVLKEGKRGAAPEGCYRFSTHKEFAKWLASTQENLDRQPVRGEGTFAATPRIELNIWQPTGAFDKIRIDRLIKLRRAALTALLETRAGDALPPYGRTKAEFGRVLDLSRFRDILETGEPASAT